MASITVELFKINPKLAKTYLNRTLAHMSENDFQYPGTLEIIGKIIFDNDLIREHINLLDNFVTDEEVNKSIELYQKWMKIEAKKMEQSSSSSISLVDLPEDLMDLKNSLNENSIHLENVLQNCLISIALSGYAKECRKFLEEEWKL